MELSTEKDVKIYFDHLSKYALTDIEKMLECADYNSQYQRLAIPIAMACFSLLDTIGFLIRNIKEGEKEPLTKSSMNVCSSLEYFFSKEIHEQQRCILVKIYRHGVMHSFFPKLAGIHNTQNQEIILSKENGTYNLNVNPFSRILIFKLRDFFANYIDSDKNKIIVDNFKLYKQDIDKSIDDYSNQLTNTTSSTSKTTSPPKYTQ